MAVRWPLTCCRNVVISGALSIRWQANQALVDIIGTDQGDRLGRRRSNANLDGRSNISGLARSHASIGTF
jgi:hypothetical protein